MRFSESRKQQSVGDTTSSVLGHLKRYPGLSSETFQNLARDGAFLEA